MYEEFEVEVTKGSGPLGLKVVGGADTNLKDVVIKEIVPNTQADIDGQLRPGDRILKVVRLFVCCVCVHVSVRLYVVTVYSV